MPVIYDTTMPVRPLMKFMDALKAHVVYTRVTEPLNITIAPVEKPNHYQVQIAVANEDKGQEIVRRITKRL